MRQVLIATAALAIVAVIEAAIHVYRWTSEARRDDLRRRLSSIADVQPGDASLLRPAKYASTPGLDAFVRGVPFSDRIERLLEQSDSRFTVAQILGYSATLGAAGLVVSSALRLGVAVSALVTLFPIAIPTLLLVSGRDRRSRKLSEQLPEALDMMARSLRAGHALSSAFELVATEMPEPVSVEFGRAFEAQRLGIPVDQAIVQMTERCPGNQDLKILGVSIVIQRETGGNLAEILGQLADTIRSRFRFHGKLRSLTAEGRASAVVVGAMPIIVVVALRVLNPEYLDPLVTTGMGRLLAASAAASWCMGLVSLYRMTQLEV